MAELEMLQESKRESTGTSQTDLLIAIPAPLGGDVLSSTIAKIGQACRLLSTPCQATLALPGEAAREDATDLVGMDPSDPTAPALRFVNYPPPPADPGAIPWLANAGAYRTISALAGKLGVRACTVLGMDIGLNVESLTAEKLMLLLDPALEGGFDLVMPLYATQAFDDLVNKSILYPLATTLYGHRVRNPLGNEFQMSSKLFPALSTEAQNP